MGPCSLGCFPFTRPARGSRCSRPEAEPSVFGLLRTAPPGVLGAAGDWRSEVWAVACLDTVLASSVCQRPLQAGPGLRGLGVFCPAPGAARRRLLSGRGQHRVGWVCWTLLVYSTVPILGKWARGRVVLGISPLSPQGLNPWA